MGSLWYQETTDHVRVRIGLWRPPADQTNAALCILLNGRTEFMEKYDEVISRLLDRGLMVMSLDWRGQGKSDRLLKDPTRGHVGAFADYHTDLCLALDTVKSVIPKPKTVTLMAHSMGGGIAWKWLAQGPEHELAPESAVLLCPMLGIKTKGMPYGLVRALAHLTAKAKGQYNAIPFAKSLEPLDYPYSNNVLTTDCARFFRYKQWLAQDPDFILGAPSCQWLLSALDVIRTPLDAKQRAALPPLFVGYSTADRIVDSDAIQNSVRSIPNAELHPFDGEHELLMECDAVQTALWAKIDAFWTQHGVINHCA